jgi:hypothetical protein
MDARRPDLSGQFDWLPFNGAVSLEHVQGEQLRASGVNMTWMPEDVTLWVTGHHVPITNIWWVGWSVWAVPVGVGVGGIGTSRARAPVRICMLPHVGACVCAYWPGHGPACSPSPATCPFPLSAIHATRYFASRMTPVYRARLLNVTGALGMPLPPLRDTDILLMPFYAAYVTQHRHSHN